MTKQSTSFWNFSNQLYARDGVASACLHLQEQFQLDVNLVLFCFWSAHFDTTVSENDWEIIFKFSQCWKSRVVQPLRDVRTWMKTESIKNESSNGVGFSTLRNRIKLDELAAEKFQQEQIEVLVSFLQSDKIEFNAKAAKSNFENLLRAQSLELVEEMNKQLDLIAESIEEAA